MARPVRGSRPNRSGLAIPLAVALLVCYAFSKAHDQSRGVRGHDPVVGVVRDYALAPAQTTLSNFSHWWRVHVLSGFQGAHLAQQNAALKARVLALTTENQQLQAAQVENDRLRALLDFQKNSPRPLLAAEVIAIKPSTQSDTIILNRGLANGVKPHTIVVAPDGSLVGQVLDSSAHTCAVLLLTDSDSSVGAQVLARNNNFPIGLCQGDHAGHLFLADLPDDSDVQVNDAVTTDGLGNVFPKGIKIGTVTSLKVDRTRSLKTATLRPAVDYDHLEEVFLQQ